MKKYILAAALVLASTSAMADRVISTNNISSGGYPAMGSSKASACGHAKERAQNEARASGEQVERYSACDCETKTVSDKQEWVCSVDATVEKSH